MSDWDDAGLAFRLRQQIDSELAEPRVDVAVEDGVVTLGGDVRSQAVADAAMQLVRRSGAHGVVDETQVAPGPPGGAVPGGDSIPGVTTPAGAPAVIGPSLEEAVLAALAEDRRVNEHLVGVRIDEGIVHLVGRQDNVDARAAAGEVAAHVPGVAGVSNELEVFPSI